jgi:hypothetical protein
MELVNEVADLLAHANFKPSQHARADLERGKVNVRLVRVLGILVQKHMIKVSVIKTDHRMEPTTPRGGVNDHYHGRAADIVAVDGTPIMGHTVDPDVIDVGKMLRDMPPQQRPDTIMGPGAWQDALNVPRNTGFINDTFHNSIHADQLHIGFKLEHTTSNQE